MDWNRRNLIGASALVGGALATAARAQTAPPAGLSGTPQAPVTIPAPPEPAGLLSSEVIEIWPPGKVPGAEKVTVSRVVLERGSPAHHDRAVTHVTRPILEVFRPAKPNGAAVVLLPGGGYVRLAVDKEGAMGAHVLTQAGITVFVLNYRLPGDGWTAVLDAPLQDAQRAVRLIRADAARWKLDPARIGVMGFSAGGHLAAAMLTRHDAKTYEPLDAADQLSARPDVVVLGYAVMAVRQAEGSSPEAAKPLDQNVRPGLPPTFIVHAADDKTVPVANSLRMFQDLQVAGVPVEMHIYQKGGHGFGFALPPSAPGSHWPTAFVAWAKDGGFLGS
jgi:acetyl esterase/lipase